MKDRRGLLIILSSPSGAGKSTLSRRLREWDPEIAFSVSATTRAARPGETNGVEYHFQSKAEFERAVSEGRMLEHAEVFGNYYGSPRAMVERQIEAGCDVLFDVDWQGAKQLMSSALKDDVLSVFILPPSIEELHRRLQMRAQDSAEVIARRMRESWNEISHWNEYDYVLVNDDIDTTFQQLKEIVSSMRLRKDRQPALTAHVAALSNEYENRK